MLNAHVKAIVLAGSIDASQVRSGYTFRQM